MRIDDPCSPFKIRHGCFTWNTKVYRHTLSGWNWVVTFRHEYEAVCWIKEQLKEYENEEIRKRPHFHTAAGPIPAVGTALK